MTGSFPAIKSMIIGARSSPLSRAQLDEVQALLPGIHLIPVYVQTHGDRDRATSLRTREKTDFFTREIDHLQVHKGCRLALHSAKDLPEPLPDGLVVAALTKGVCSSDSLVLREGDTLQSLPPKAAIATSSLRREKAVKRLRHDLTFVDIRGSIEERLQILHRREIHGVVIAEAALLRLGLTPNRVRLPGSTAPFQGQLALLAREEDLEARLLVAPLDSRSQARILYLGLDPSYFCQQHRPAQLLHYPVIRIQYRAFDLTQKLAEATHVLFTSKSAVKAVASYSLTNKRLIAVGTVTAQALSAIGYHADVIAEEETAEGVIAALRQESLTRASVLWPRGNRARRLIADYLISRKVPFEECIVYDTHLHHPCPPPSLDEIDEIVFTSPSTVDGFLQCYGALPSCRTTTQGPITRQYLERRAAALS